MPAWRHALINYPHPLLKQGLVVLDTPGLNAIGAEPELTLSLLPSAHAIVFILGADTGVTKSDLAIWRDHLGAQAPTRFVVLNKIDALVDPLATLEQVEAQIAQQQRETARTLGVGAAAGVPAVGAAGAGGARRGRRHGAEREPPADPRGRARRPAAAAAPPGARAGGRRRARSSIENAGPAAPRRRAAASSPSRCSSCAACAARAAPRSA